jgi:histidinol-phosphate aminotransferase
MPRFDPRAALRAPLRALPRYEALEDLDAVAEQYGVRPEDVIKLDGNENPYGPSPRALDALRGAYPAHRYGDADQRRLRTAIAARAGVGPENVVVGAGSDELIDLVFRLFVAEGDRIVTASPTFGMYGFDAHLQGAEVVDVPRGEDWEVDREGLLEAAAGSKSVFIPSPNNPTGGLLPEAVVDGVLDSGSLLVVDEAYIEFSHGESLARRAASDPALVVLRTFSKWGGLAGLRVGYGVMAPEVTELMRAVQQPYTVNIAAEAAALASLEDCALLDERACIVAGERDRVADAMRNLGWLEPAPSEANFLLCRTFRGDGRTLRDALRRRGIFVRYLDTSRLRQHIRISLGTPEQNDRVLEALAEIGSELEGAK